MSKIKSKLCDDLIKYDLVKPYYVINHSFTDNGERDLDKVIISKDNILPCLTTRPDILGVVIDEQET